MRPRMLGERLVAAGLVKQNDLDRALRYQEAHNCPLGAALVDLGICDMTTVLGALSAQREERHRQAAG